MPPSSSSTSEHANKAVDAEWPEVLQYGEVGVRYRVKVDQMANKPKKVINIESMSQDDLESMRKRDPFMYHSIPALRMAAVRFEASDPRAPGVPRRRVSDPSRPQEADPQEATRGGEAHKVSRKTRLSFEVHPDVILKDLADDDEESYTRLMMRFHGLR